MRSLLNFAAGFVALAIACCLLLPPHHGGIARGVGIHRVAFWLVLSAGAAALIVKLVRR